jgi:para-aminobenzoate synthetase / 4-amino-4-deoxychorismate lyase
MPYQLVRRPLDWQLSAADVLRLVRDDPHPVALTGAWAGGSDIVAASPVRVCGPPGPVADVLATPLPGRPAQGGAAFGGGWIGYLGFGLAGQFLPVPPPPGEPRQLPAWWFGYYDHVLRRDRATGRWVFEALCTPDRAAALDRRFRELTSRPQAAPRDYTCGPFRLTPTPDEHRAAVRQTIDCIRRGDVFQANICLRLDAEFSGDPLDAFCRAVMELDPPYAAFLRTPDGAVASLSPELFLRRTGTSVLTQPIKGTRPRPAGEPGARRQRQLLERSAKDRAENVMIVDLMRNDLSRVCRPGSVRVPALLRAEAHPGVWHLVSDVRGTLPAGAGDAELIAAAFPPGSVTGAPKVRALEIIHELEATPREVYTGAIGYRSPLAGLELNVAIRTFEFRGGQVWLGSGGGITARSDPAAEYHECLVKARPLIHALNASISDAPVPPARPAGSAKAAPPPSLRPRPAVGVFTSLRVTSGHGQDLGRHLARLAESSWQLFGKRLPPDLDAGLARCLAGWPSGRLRITARPAGGPLQVTIEVVREGPALEAVSLHPVTVPGGLGGHKWRDRRLLASLTGTAGLGPDGHLLIEDGTGEVLETDRANVFAVIDGVLCTPPADGRLLPGITRAAVLRLASCHGIPVKETPVSRRQLLAASEVLVTNSVHGVVPARSLAGAPVAWAPGPVAVRLRDALARRPTSVAPPAAGPVTQHEPGRLQHGRAHPAGPVIVLVDNYDSFTYNLAHLLLRHGGRVEVVRNDEVAAADIAGFAPDGIVISPGPGTPAEAGISVGTVRACPAIPLLGICLGHQAIAAAHGARISAAPEPVHGQAAPVSHDGQGVLAGLPQGFPAARYHSLIVDEDSLPPGLLITARGPGGIPMGLRHAGQPAEGLQFHPESILTAHGGGIISNFIRQARRTRRPARPAHASATRRLSARSAAPCPPRPAAASPAASRRRPGW